MRRRIAAAVAIAGIVGATVRWGVAALLDENWALLIVNVLGCGLVGWANARHERSRLGRHAAMGPSPASGRDTGPSPWLTAGFCGALTSMSALALQLARHLDDGQLATAAAWLALTIVACTTAFAGCRLAVTAVRRRP